MAKLEQIASVVPSLQARVVEEFPDFLWAVGKCADADASETDREAGQSKRAATLEGVVTDGSEIWGEAVQCKGATTPESPLADGGEAVREAGQCEGFAAMKGVTTDVGESSG